MFRVFDSRTDIQNLIIRPDIRARFLRMEPGEANVVHSHDLGEEIFLVLEGQAEFEIEGHCEILGPGQLCFAARDERHLVRCVGDQPMTMYLSVTPHIEPTHTWWGDDGTKLSPRYGGSTRAERSARTGESPAITDLAELHLAAVKAVEDSLSHAASAQQDGVKALLQAVDGEDAVARKQAIDQMWEALYPALSAVRDMAGSWNELAVHAASEDE